jgi:hypothetical protein
MTRDGSWEEETEEANSPEAETPVEEGSGARREDFGPPTSPRYCDVPR